MIETPDGEFGVIRDGEWTGMVRMLIERVSKLFTGEGLEVRTNRVVLPVAENILHIFYFACDFYDSGSLAALKWMYFASVFACV